MIQNVSHACLFLTKLLGAIFGALMLTFILGEFPGQFSGLSARDVLLLILGGIMSVGLIISLFKPLIGGIAALVSILGINAMAYVHDSAAFEFDFPLQLIISILLLVFSLILKRGEMQET
jgi:hypothetical protein